MGAGLNQLRDALYRAIASKVTANPKVEHAAVLMPNGKISTKVVWSR
jgi:hypothetical protein